MRIVAIASVCVCLCLSATGCIYLDPIETQPTAAIQPSPDDPSLHVVRGSQFVVTGTLDRDHEPGTFQWTVTACAGVSTGHALDCDAAPFISSPAAATDSTTFVVPAVTPGTHQLTQAIRVELAARDNRGALARTGSAFDYAVADGAPVVALASSAPTYTVGVPIDLFARCSDPDDAADALTVDWAVTGPVANQMLVPISVPNPDPSSRTVGMQLVPPAAGSWDVQVTVRDPEGAATVQHLTVGVNVDLPPCLAQWQPIVPTGAQPLPITQPTRFEVPEVDDDLDPYPPRVIGTSLGAARFAWSMAVLGQPGSAPGPAATWQPLAGATGNSIDFDPAGFVPGDLVELRVEIFDRAHNMMTCPDDQPTCSIDGGNGCIQRQTWRVEAL